MGGTTGKSPCVRECRGTWGGCVYTDNCGECVGGSIRQSACSQDCTGKWGSTAFSDDCGICVGGTTGLEKCVPITDITITGGASAAENGGRLWLGNPWLQRMREPV